jgi:hypothetical protein
MEVIVMARRSRLTLEKRSKRERLKEAGRKLKERAGSVAGTVGDRGRDVRDRAAEEAERRELRSRARRAAAGARERIAEADVGGEPSDPMERAERAATMGPPVNATLDPISRPQDMQFLASANLGTSREAAAAERAREEEAARSMEALVLGVGGEAGERDADPFGVAVGFDLGGDEGDDGDTNAEGGLLNLDDDPLNFEEER